MSSRHIVLVLALAGVVSGLRAQTSRSSNGGSVALRAGVASLVTAHDSLAARFRRLVTSATAPGASPSARQAVVTFVRAEIEPQLSRESIALFPTFDSIIGGGYAVPATLLDLDGIAFLAQEVARTAGASRGDFEARLYALSSALESYFTKTDLLVLPVLHERLGSVALTAVLTSATSKAGR